MVDRRMSADVTAAPSLVRRRERGIRSHTGVPDGEADDPGNMSRVTALGELGRA